MRYLIPVLVLLIGCESDLGTERTRSIESAKQVDVALAVEAAPSQVEDAKKESALPSRSMTAYPHVPGLAHVSVFSVYLTNTEVTAK